MHSPADKPAAEEAAAEKPAAGSRRVVLIGGAIVVIIGTAVTGLWLLLGQGDEPTSAASASVPLVAQPAGPPPAYEAALAPPTAEGMPSLAAVPLDKTIERLPGIIQGLHASLASAPLDPGAPANLIVLASGSRSAADRGDIPRHERWEIQFPPGNTVESYARQLDYFQIELGVLGGSDKVTYLSKLAEHKPAARTAPAADETRLYLIWQRGPLQVADEEIVMRAELSPRDKVLAHFCSEELETRLARLETSFARKSETAKIRKTIFGIKPDVGDGFQFYVIDQQADE
jgi:hypothetical protein